MAISNHVLERLKEKYSHSESLLEAFTPLFEARLDLAKSLSAVILPKMDKALIMRGKAAFMPDQDNLDLYLDDEFLAKAPEVLCVAAEKGFEQKKHELEKLKTVLQENSGAASELAAFSLTGEVRRVPEWAEKYRQDKDVARLLSSHMAGAAARRVARAASSLIPALWNKGHCPICGSEPQAGFLREKEGHRFLICALCGHEWRFSRTVCPFCEDANPEKRQISFVEDDSWFRAESCEICRRYLPVPDLRSDIGDIPLELILLCLMPLDILMQEKGYE